MANFILIRPTVWPQCTNVTDRTDRHRQQSDSIGRTVLQMVAQKMYLRRYGMVRMNFRGVSSEVKTESTVGLLFCNCQYVLKIAK